MEYKSIWEDLIFTTTASTADDISEFNIGLVYKPKSQPIQSGTTINVHNGCVKSMPGEYYDDILYGRIYKKKIYINDYISEYLKPDFEDDSWITASTKTLYNPYAMFEETTRIGNASDTKRVLYDWSYDSSLGDWGSNPDSSSVIAMSEPINNHIDPRMKIMYTLVRYSSANVDWRIDG